MWGAGDKCVTRFPKSLFVQGAKMSSADDLRPDSSIALGRAGSSVVISTTCSGSWAGWPERAVLRCRARGRNPNGSSAGGKRRLPAGFGPRRLGAPPLFFWKYDGFGGGQRAKRFFRLGKRGRGGPGGGGPGGG